MLNIQKKREAKGWSKSELARRAKMASPTIGQIESRRLRPYDSQLIKIARALEIPEDQANTLLDEIEK